MPQGGELKIETKNISIDQEFAKDHLDFQTGKYVTLAIKDCGTGMGRSTIEHIFDPTPVPNNFS